MTGVVGLTGAVGFDFVLAKIRGVGAASFAEPVAPGFLPTGEACDGSGRGRASGFASDEVTVLTFLEGEPKALTESLRATSAEAPDDDESDSSSSPKSMKFRFLFIVGVKTSGLWNTAEAP